MFTVIWHEPPPADMSGVGTEHVIGNVESVKRLFDADGPIHAEHQHPRLPGVHVTYGEGSGCPAGSCFLFTSGRFYVMNEQGQTVARYILDNMTAEEAQAA